MAQISKVDDHGLEVLKKAGFIPDDTKLTEYALRTSATGTFTPSGLQTNIRTTTLDVSTTAQLLPTIALENRNSLIVYNSSQTDKLYLGGSDVTADMVLGTTSGYELAPQSFFNIDITDDIVLYGIVSNGTVRVKVTEVA